MKAKREAPARRSAGTRRVSPARGHGERRRGFGDTAHKSVRRPGGGKAPAPAREARASRSAPQTTPISRPAVRPARPKNTGQAKDRAKARKAKAPKVVRLPLRERLILKLTSVDLRPRTLAAKVPFVVLVIASLALGLAITLWLSTDSAERSYQLGNARERNEALTQQKEALERDVLEAQAAPALAEAARNLGMIPSKDTAHLVQDPAGNWVVVGSPKPAEGVPPPPFNTKLPDETPAASAKPPVPPRSVDAIEVPVGVSPNLGAAVGAAPSAPDVPVPTPAGGATPLGVEYPLATVAGPTVAGPTVAGPHGTQITGPVPGLAPVGAPAALPADAQAAQVADEQFGPAIPAIPGAAR